MKLIINVIFKFYIHLLTMYPIHLGLNHCFEKSLVYVKFLIFLRQIFDKIMLNYFYFF